MTAGEAMRVAEGGQDEADLAALCEILKAAIGVNFAGHPNVNGLAISALSIAAGDIYMTAKIQETKEPSKAERRRLEKHLIHNFAAGMKVAKNRAARLARESGATFQ